jgi:hypothetical protein
MMSAWNDVGAISVQLKDEIGALHEKEARGVHTRRDDVMRAKAQVCICMFVPRCACVLHMRVFCICVCACMV